MLPIIGEPEPHLAESCGLRFVEFLPVRHFAPVKAKEVSGSTIPNMLTLRQYWGGKRNPSNREEVRQLEHVCFSDGQNRQSTGSPGVLLALPIGFRKKLGIKFHRSSVPWMQLTLISHSTVACGTNAARMNANWAIQIAAKQTQGLWGTVPVVGREVWPPTLVIGITVITLTSNSWSLSCNFAHLRDSAFRKGHATESFLWAIGLSRRLTQRSKILFEKCWLLQLSWVLGAVAMTCFHMHLFKPRAPIAYPHHCYVGLIIGTKQPSAIYLAEVALPQSGGALLNFKSWLLLIVAIKSHLWNRLHEVVEWLLAFLNFQGSSCRGQNLNTIYLLKLFGHPRDIPAKIPGYPAQEFGFPGLRRTYRTFWPPLLHVEDPHPRKISGPKSLGLCSSFLPDLGMWSQSEPYLVHAHNGPGLGGVTYRTSLWGVPPICSSQDSKPQLYFQSGSRNWLSGSSCDRRYWRATCPTDPCTCESIEISTPTHDLIHHVLFQSWQCIMSAPLQLQRWVDCSCRLSYLAIL